MTGAPRRFSKAAISSADPPPAFWRQEAKAFIALARQNALVPVEQLYAHQGGQELFQHLLVLFGQALTWWPTIMETMNSCVG